MNDVTQNGADDVKRHRWFKGLDWDEVFYRKLKVNKRPCLISPSRHNNNKKYANKIIFLLLLKLYPFQILSIFEFFLFFFPCTCVKPPIVPKVSYDGDTCNFDEYPEADWQRTPCVTEKDYKLFESF